MKKYKVIKNTYPRTLGIPHAEPGDIVTWQPQRNKSRGLVRESDKATILNLACFKEKVFHESGIIAQVKSRGWVLEIAEVEEDNVVVSNNT